MPRSPHTTSPSRFLTTYPGSGITATICPEGCTARRPVDRRASSRRRMARRCSTDFVALAIQPDFRRARLMHPMVGPALTPHRIYLGRACSGATLPGMHAIWTGVIGKLDTPTRDGRFLLTGEHPITTYELPLVILAASGDSFIHVGLIDRVGRTGNDIVGSGTIDTKLFALLNDPPRDPQRIPIAIATDFWIPIATATDLSNGPNTWHLVGAYLTESAWGDTTITIIENEQPWINWGTDDGTPISEDELDGLLDDLKRTEAPETAEERAARQASLARILADHHTEEGQR